MNIKVEPSLIAVGVSLQLFLQFAKFLQFVKTLLKSKHIAIVLNNKAWFYEIRRNTNIFLYEHDYITVIREILIFYYQF